MFQTIGFIPKPGDPIEPTIQTCKDGSVILAVRFGENVTIQSSDPEFFVGWLADLHHKVLSLWLDTKTEAELEAETIGEWEVWEVRGAALIGQRDSVYGTYEEGYEVAHHIMATKGGTWACFKRTEVEVLLAQQAAGAADLWDYRLAAGEVA